MLLADQDRARWDVAVIKEGVELVGRALRRTPDHPDQYVVQAAIAACHALAPSYAETNWDAVISWYDVLLAWRTARWPGSTGPRRWRSGTVPQRGWPWSTRSTAWPATRGGTRPARSCCTGWAGPRQARAAYRQALALGMNEPQAGHLRGRTALPAVTRLAAPAAGRGDGRLPGRTRSAGVSAGEADDGDMDAAGAVAGGHAGYSGVCPFTVDKPVMRQRWERLTFLHWSYDPDVVQRLLPCGLTVDTFGGAAWVGLVPFFMRVHTPGDHGAPWVSNFCETNVRTYAVDREGRAGIWFLSLDAARLGAVAVARASYQLPYYWSSMRISGPLAAQSRRRQEIAYSASAACRARAAATSQVRVRVGAPYQPAELGTGTIS